MGIERKSTVIDGVTYEVTQLGTTAAAKILLRLMELTAKPVAMLGTVAGSMDPAAILGAAADAFASGLKASDIDTVVKPLLESLTADEVPVGGKLFDDHFAGKIGRLLRVFKWALAENYSDFFGELVSSIGDLTKTTR